MTTVAFRFVKEFDGRCQVRLDVTIAVEDQDRVAQQRLRQLERSPGSERFSALGNS